MSILATDLDWPEGTKFFEVQCRLGLLGPDGEDADKAPDVKTLGGTVRIAPRTPSGRIRILEPDGKYRVVVTTPLTFAINESTGKLVNTADNTEGVWIVDPTSDTIDPKGFTYSAVVTPKVGSRFTVEFDGTVAINGVYDLANGAPVAPLRGDSLLESRIAKLELEGGPAGPKGDSGPDGRGIESITDDDEDGIASVLFTDGATSELVLPRGPQGKTGPTPEVTWEGTSLTVGDQPPVDLKGTPGASIVRAIDGDGVVSFELSDGSTTEPVILPQGRPGDTGPAPTVSWEGTSLVVGDQPPVDLKGDTGADGRGIESITDDDEDGIATVLYTDGVTDALPLPRGPQGDPAPPPEIAWAGDVLTVDGVSSPPLSGPAGPAPTTSWLGTSLIVGDNPPVDLQGPQGVRGPIGVPGAVATASDYLLVGPGRPDGPATTGGIITGSEPVGCEYRSADGAGVGAWVWMKRPTGWEVTDGDTGWRMIGIEDGLTIAVKRTLGIVYVRHHGPLNSGTWPVTATDDDATKRRGGSALSARGFVPPVRAAVPIYSLQGGMVGALYFADRSDIPGARFKLPEYTGNALLHGYFLTTEPWPATLPGSPA